MEQTLPVEPDWTAALSSPPGADAGWRGSGPRAALLVGATRAYKGETRGRKSVEVALQTAESTRRQGPSCSSAAEQKGLVGRGSSSHEASPNGRLPEAAQSRGSSPNWEERRAGSRLKRPTANRLAMTLLLPGQKLGQTIDLIVMPAGWKGQHFFLKRLQPGGFLGQVDVPSLNGSRMRMQPHHFVPLGRDANWFRHTVNPVGFNGLNEGGP